jgi:hypothetical protein
MRKLLAVTSVLVFVAVASADITGSVIGPTANLLTTGDTAYTWELQVTITGSDAWTVAGGPVVGTPWINVAGGTFYQDPMNDTNPPNPAFFGMVPDSEFTSFYTTHLGYPNVANTGVSPGFAYGPVDQPTSLNADWFWTPDGNDYPGTYTVAQFSIIEDVPGTPACATIDMQIGSREIGVTPFQGFVCTPEPGSLALLALGGLALIRRR